MTIKSRLVLLSASILWCAAGLAASEEPSLASGWSEDFADQAAFDCDWSQYGFLADGRDDKHPHGRPVSGKNVTPSRFLAGMLEAENEVTQRHHEEPAGP